MFGCTNRYSLYNDKCMKFLPSFLFLISSSLVLAANNTDLPEIGDSAGSVISPEFDRRLGNAFLRQIRRSAPVNYDPEVEAYIQSIGYRLAANSDENTKQFVFFVINQEMINAFAGPGGVIGINSGVILNSRNESELAAVMAHEIAHVTQRHMARAFEKASQMNLPVAAALIGSLLVGLANPDAGMAALMATQGAAIQSQINFTRANEEEADSIGMQLLARSDFDPRGMPGFFERLQQGSKYYQGNAPEFLRTHPVTSARIAESQARVEDYPIKPYETSNTYLLIRAKLKAFSYNKPTDAVAALNLEMRNAEDKESLNAARYGYAFALLNADNYRASRKQISTLLKEDENNIHFLMAAGQIEHAAKHYKNSLGIYEEAYKYYPDYRPLVLYYAKTLLDDSQAEKARGLLLKYGRNHESDITFLNLLSQAEAQSGSMVESFITKAEYYYLLGDTELAIQRLRLAQEQGKLDYYQKERITARLIQFEYERELEKELKL